MKRPWESASVVRELVGSAKVQAGLTVDDRVGKTDKNFGFRIADFEFAGLDGEWRLAIDNWKW